MYIGFLLLGCVFFHRGFSLISSPPSSTKCDYCSMNPLLTHHRKQTSESFHYNLMKSNTALSARIIRSGSRTSSNFYKTPRSKSDYPSKKPVGPGDFTLEPHIDIESFGSSLESSPALVLNADYTPLSFLPLSLWSWQDSLRAILSGKAVMVESYGVYIRSVSLQMEMPSVIALKQYHYPPSRPPAISRRNVYLRDCFKCQYCVESFHPSDLSLDHVVPRSKGGKLTWENTVTACKVCNFKKGQTMPDNLKSIGMKLRKLPAIPSVHELQARSKKYRRSKTHPHWEAFLS